MHHANPACHGWIRKLQTRALGPTRATGEASTKHAQEVVNSTVDRIRAHGMAAEGLVRHGDARTEIVEEATHWLADVVLVGSHGRTGVTRWLVGSVAEHVARHAPCTVEIVRSRAAA